VALLAGAALIALTGSSRDRNDSYEWYAPIIDVRNMLVDHYIAEPDLNAMQSAAISAMVDSLGDPYSVFVPRSQEGAFNKELRGTYVGIGAEVNIINDYLTIISPMDDSPALEAGLLPGDIVLMIDGEPTYRQPIDRSIALLMGDEGTASVLRVRSPDGEERDVTIERRKIVTRTVRGLRRNGENWEHCVNKDLGIAYVRLTQFNSTTAAELSAVLTELQMAPQFDLNGLVLDLRDNPGGSLKSAVDTADLFLESGMIVTVRGRTSDENAADEQMYTAHRPGTLPDIPLIVLINGHSASAAEIVAGALQDNQRAIVLGSRSHGKGSVQEVRPLPSGHGTLKLTTAHYELPSGRSIQRTMSDPVWGVDPSPGFAVHVTSAQARDMVLARRETDKLFGGPSVFEFCTPTDWIRLELRDEQLALAVEAMSAKLRTGHWQPVGEEDNARLAIEHDVQRQLERRAELLAQLDQTESRIRDLNALAESAGSVPLLPPDIDLVQGTLTIRDRLGNLVGTFRIDGGDLERALQVVKLTPTNE